jgi:hypothetical protein
LSGGASQFSRNKTKEEYDFKVSSWFNLQPKITEKSDKLALSKRLVGMDVGSLLYSY